MLRVLVALASMILPASTALAALSVHSERVALTLLGIALIVFCRVMRGLAKEMRPL
jgi:hypothetical protein